MPAMVMMMMLLVAYSWIFEKTNKQMIQWKIDKPVHITFIQNALTGFRAHKHNHNQPSTFTSTAPSTKSVYLVRYIYATDPNNSVHMLPIQQNEMEMGTFWISMMSQNHWKRNRFGRYDTSTYTNIQNMYVFHTETEQEWWSNRNIRKTWFHVISCELLLTLYVWLSWAMIQSCVLLRICEKDERKREREKKGGEDRNRDREGAGYICTIPSAYSVAQPVEYAIRKTRNEKIVLD